MSSDPTTTVEDLISDPSFLIAISALVVVALYYFVCSCSGGRNKRHSDDSDSEHEEKIKTDPIYLTREELRFYDGIKDENAPVYVCINGSIYDVSSRRDMYGKGGGYNLFAGFDVTRALAKSSFDEEDRSNYDTSDLTIIELQTLAGWEMKFAKYPVVGQIVENEKEKKEKEEEMLKEKNGEGKKEE